MFYSVKMKCSSAIILCLSVGCIVGRINNSTSQATVCSLFSSPWQSARPSAGPCKWLQASRRQNNQCRREPGLAPALFHTKQLAISHCEEQFRYDRWNCSIYTKGKRNIFKRLYRETAFVHALVAAALMHSISRACALGNMTRCQCAHERDPEATRHTWRWGGCGDNMKHGRRMARNFLQLKAEMGDQMADMLRHNGEVGLQAVKEQVHDICKCHGISGSCTVRTCWRRLSEFNYTAALLKVRYHHAVKRATHNQSYRRSLPGDRAYKQLLYLEKSPTFCAGTSGRRCTSPDNCATLCCGRGYHWRTVNTARQCNCRCVGCCQVQCDTCSVREVQYTCK